MSVRFGRWTAATLVVAALATGCSAVPLRSMAKLARMGEADLYRLNPQVVRVAVQHDQRIDVEPTATKITYIVSAKDGSVSTDEISLRVLTTGEAVDPDLAPARAGLEWTLLAISPEGVEAMRELQTRLELRREEIRELEISVNAQFTDLGDVPRREFPLDVWLRLEAGKGFIQILRGPVDLESYAAAGPAPEVSS